MTFPLLTVFVLLVASPVWGAEVPSVVASPGVRRMNERLVGLNREQDPMANLFRNRERAEIRGALLARETEPGKVWQALPSLAEELVKAGDPQRALETLRRFDAMTQELHQRIQPKQRQWLQFQAALCNLRLGEQQNCLTNHTIDSCLFPIGRLGVYQRPAGAREAIRILTGLLQESPDNLKAVWLLNLACMTVGDYPAGVPPQWLLPPKALESGYDLKRFIDVASGAGLDLPGPAGGVVMEDFDGDGFLDLMISNWRMDGQLRLFRNNGDGTFTERTRESGLVGEWGGLNLIQADYNNDGYPDVFLMRGAWLGAAGNYPCSLLRNNGDGTFEDVTEAAGLLRFRRTQTAVWLDFNNDGWVDLFVGAESVGTNQHPCELYRNNGNGTFTECGAEAGVNVVAFVKGVAAGDFNNDGRPDLYLSTRSGVNFLFRNDGPRDPARGAASPWAFRNVAVEAGVTDQRASFPAAFLDYDNDGWPDILVTGYALQDLGDIVRDYLGQPFQSETARLFRNNHDGTFSNVTHQVGLDHLIHAMALNFGDFDNDGWLDFYTGTGDPDFATLIPNRAFRNAGGKVFQDVTTSSGLGQLQKGHAIAFGDINNDGTQDIFTVIGGAYTDDTYRTVLYKNPGHGNHWITLKLEGVKSNRGAIGARIKVTVRNAGGVRAIHRTVGSGASFGASPLRQEIGLGAADEIVEVEVRWPSTGASQVLRGLEMDRFYKVREGDPVATPWALRSFKLRPPNEKLCAPEWAFPTGVGRQGL